MAHFRAVIKGARGEASRLGTKSSGMYAKVQTWGWDVVVKAWEGTKHDICRIELENHTTGERRDVGMFNLTTGEQINTTPYQPKTGQPCSCRPGVERDNCPACEGTGQRIDFATIRTLTTQQEL